MLGPMARCQHCGVLSVDEALACEMGDCHITDWHVPVSSRAVTAGAVQKPADRRRVSSRGLGADPNSKAQPLKVRRDRK